MTAEILAAINRATPAMTWLATAVTPERRAQWAAEDAKIADADGKLIPISKGLHAVVDAADYDWLSQWKWSAQKTPEGNCYARRVVSVGGKQAKIYMHRVILDAPKGSLVDHANRNGLDNRRTNIRLCTASENARNVGSGKGSTSQYLGVSWHSARGNWVAHISANGKSKYLGSFKCELDAARAYDAAAHEYFGEFANPNFRSK